MANSIDEIDKILQGIGSSSDAKIDESLGIKDNTLEVIDGDTARDKITGRIFRFKGYDSLETLDSKKARKLENESGIPPDDTTGSSMLEMMINAGKITAKDIYDNYTGERDKYGRLLVDIPSLAEASISSGKAVSSNKYDRKRQELTNKEIEKLYSIGEDDRAKELEALKEYNNDATDQGLGILERPWNDLKGAYASLGRASSSMGDFALDTTSAIIDTALGSKKGDSLYLGDSTYFNKLKDKEYSDNLNGYQGTEPQIALDEGLHNIKIGWNSKNSNKMKYAKGAWEAFKQADALFAESAGDMALMMTPLGESSKLMNVATLGKSMGFRATDIAKTKTLLEGAKGLALKNGGLLSYTLGETNTALEDRAKNNFDGETSGSAINTFTFLLAKNAIDKVSFEHLIKGKAGAFNVDNIKKLISGSSPSAQRALTAEMLTTALDLSKRAAIGGGEEFATEAIQTYGELLATTLGTDTFGNNFPTDQKTIDTVLKSALAGMSIGAGMSGVHALPDTTRRLGEDSNLKATKIAEQEAKIEELSKKYGDKSNDTTEPSPTSDNTTTPKDNGSGSSEVKVEPVDSNPTPPSKEEPVKQESPVDSSTPTENTHTKPNKKIDTNRVTLTLNKHLVTISAWAKREPKDNTERQALYDEGASLESNLHKSIGKENIDEMRAIENAIAYDISEEEYNAMVTEGIVPKRFADNGYTMNELIQIGNINRELNAIENKKNIHKDILDGNPVTKKSLSDNKTDNISSFMDIPNIDEVETNDVDIQEQIDLAREYNESKDENQVAKEVFVGDNGNVGIAQWEQRLSDATPKQIEESGYARFVKSKNDRAVKFSEALDESNKTGKPVEIGVNNRGTTEFVDANNKKSVALVDTVQREAKAVQDSYNKFLEKRGGNPSTNPIVTEPSKQPTTEELKTKDDKKVVGSHISNIEKSKTLSELESNSKKAIKDLSDKKILKDYKSEISKSYNAKKKELSPRDDTKTIDGEKENRTERLERKHKALDDELDAIYETKDGEWKSKYKENQKQIKVKMKKLDKLLKDHAKVSKKIEEAEKKKASEKESLNKAKAETLAKTNSISQLLSLSKKLVEQISEVIKSISNSISNLYGKKDKLQKRIDDLNKEISSLIEVQTKSKPLRQTRDTVMTEYKKRLKSTGKVTDEFISKTNTIDKGFYSKLQKMKLPKGMQLGSMKAFDTWDLISHDINGMQGSDYSLKPKEIEYFNSVVRPILEESKKLVQNITDRGQIFAMDFNKEDSDKYNEMLKGLDEDTLINIVAFVAIDGMMNQGGEIFSENTNEDIAKLLGLNSEHDVTAAMRSRFKYGKLQSNVVSSLSGLMNEYISLKSSDPLARERFGSAIALLATHLLRTSKLANIEQYQIRMSEFNSYRANPYSNTNGNKMVNFLRSKGKSPMRGKGKAVLKNVFRMDLPQERTTPHKPSKDKAIHKQQQVGRQIRQEIIDLYQELGAKEFKDYMRNVMGYDFYFANKAGAFTHASKHASIKGKNLQIDDSIDALIEVIEDVGSKQMYFRYKRADEQRMHLVAELINPQSNKLHRFLTHAVNSKRTVDTKDEGRMLIWKSAILDSLGIKSEKLTPNEILQEFSNLLQDSDLMTFITSNDTHPSIELINKYGEKAHTIQGLIELKKFANRTGDTFETTLEKETDAKTSGSTLQSIFYFNPLDENSIRMLHKGGVYTNQTSTTKNTEYLGLDNYEESGIEMNSRVEDKNNDYEHNRKPEPPTKDLDKYEQNKYAAKVSRYNLYNKFFKPMLETWALAVNIGKGSKALKQARDFFKTPIIAKGYTAGDKSVQDSKFDEMIMDFYDKLENIAGSKSTIQELKSVIEMVHAIKSFNVDINNKEINRLDKNGKPFESPFNEDNINELLSHLDERLKSLENPTLKNKYNHALYEFMFTSEQLQILRTNYSNTMGKVVTDSMNKVLEPFKQGTNIIQKVSNMQNRYFLDEFFKRLDAYHKEHGFISKDVIAEITNKLIADGIAPVLKTFEGKDGELMKRGFNDQINSIIEGKNYQVKVSTKGDTKHMMSTQSIGVTSWTDIGVRTPALSTLMTDAGILANTIDNTKQEDMGLYIFDAVLSAEGGAKQYNSSVNDLVENMYSPIVEVIKMAKKAFSNYEWNEDSIEALINNNIQDTKRIKYRTNAKYRLNRFHKLLVEDGIPRENIDAMMINAISSLTTSNNGEVHFDPISIDFHSDLNRLNRSMLKDMVTTIEHSVGIDDGFVRNESKFSPVSTDSHSELYNKYKDSTNESLENSESLDKLNNEINNYTPKENKSANDLTVDDLLKKSANPELGRIEYEDVIEAMDSLTEQELDNLNGWNLLKFVVAKIPNKALINLNSNKIVRRLVEIKKAKQDINNTKKSIETNEEFKPKFKFDVTKDNIINSFKKISNWSNDKIDSIYESKLSNVLSNVIAPVMETITVFVGKTDAMSYGEAQESNIARIAIANNGSSNMSMSAQEVYVHELLHNIFHNPMKEFNVFVYQITDMMKDIKSKYGKDVYKLFLPKDGVYTIEDEQLAKRMASHVFGGKGDTSEFASYGLSNKNFMDNLSGISTLTDGVDGSFLSKIVNIAMSALSKLKMAINTGRIDSNMQSQLETLVKKSAGITVKSEIKAFEKIHKAYRFLGDKYNDNLKPTLTSGLTAYTEKMIKIRHDLLMRNNTVNELEHVIRFMSKDVEEHIKNIRDYKSGNVKTIAKIIAIMTMNHIPFTSKDFGLLVNRYMSEQLSKIDKFSVKEDGIWNGIVDELQTLKDNVFKTAEDTFAEVSELRRSIKDVDITREQLRTHTNELINEKIQHMGLNPHEESLLGNILNSTKIGNLLEAGYSFAQVIELIKNPNEEIKRLQSIVPPKSLVHIKKLAKYRIDHNEKTKFRNIHVITDRFGFDKKNEMVALASLLGLKYYDESVLEKITSDKDNFSDLLTMSNAYEKEMLDQIYYGNTDLVQDGLIIQNSNKVNFTRYVLESNKNENKRTKELDGVKIKTVKNPFGSGNVIVYSVPPSREPYTRGALVYGTKSVGKNLDQLYFELYNRIKPNHVRVHNREYVFDKNGGRFDFDPLTLSEKKQYLNHADNVSDIYANQRARGFEKQKSKEVNERIVDTIVLRGLEENETLNNRKDKTDNNKWIKISAPFASKGFKNKVSEYDGIWYMLPQETRDYIIEKYQGRFYIPANGNTKNILLGSRDAAFHNLFNKMPHIKKAVKFAEDFWKELMGLWKATVIIKFPLTLLSNFVSNLFLTKSKGYSLKEIYAKQKEGFLYLADYMRSDELLKQEELKRDSGLLYDEAMIDELNSRLNNNKVKGLIDEGLLSARIEDITINKAFESLKPVREWIDRAEEVLPENVVKIGKELYMTEDTNYFKMMYHFTQASDFVARYAQTELEYQHNKSKTQQQIFDEALDDFVQYDIPLGKYVRWADQVAWFPFIKYYLRMQKVMHRLLGENPKTVIGMEAFEKGIYDIATPYENSWLFMTPDEKMRNPFGNIEDIITPTPVHIINDML